jgi:hypothetical protein
MRMKTRSNRIKKKVRSCRRAIRKEEKVRSEKGRKMGV